MDMKSLSVLGLLGMILSLLSGCGGCKTIKQTQDRLLPPQNQSATRWNSGPHVGLYLPRKWVDLRIEKALKKKKLNTWKPPAIKGIGLPKFFFKIKELKWTLPTKTAPLSLSSIDTSSKSPLGLVELKIATQVKKKTLLHLTLKGTSPLAIDLKKKKLHFKFDAQSLKSIQIKPSKSVTKKLKKWISKQIPPPVRLLLSDALLNKAIRTLITLLNQNALPLLQQQLTPLLTQKVAFHWDLPPFPISNLSLSSSSYGWQVLIWSSIGGHGLDLDLIQKHHSKSKTNSRSTQSAFLFISPSWVTQMANWAMDQRKLPSAYTLKGKPDPKGPIRVRMEWNEQKNQNALRIHAWMNTETGGNQCFYAQMGGQPKLKLRKKKLHVQYKGQLETLEGDLLVWLVSTLKGLGSKTFKMKSQLAIPSKINLAGQKLQWKWDSIEQTVDFLKFHFKLKR